MPNKSVNLDSTKTIESALSGVGVEARELILKCIREKYGMNLTLIMQYQDEFANYLREIIGDSAESVIKKLDEVLPKSCSTTQKRSRHSLSEKVPDCVFFIICEHCFWCATLLKHRFRKVCPICRKKIREIIPISNGESFNMSVDEKRGITLSFK